jgi:CBS domain containing-hemolysin-like protein
MTAFLIVAAIWLPVSLVVVTFVQVLYLESLRLRARELPALEFFRKTLRDRMGVAPERGALAFSLIKHTSIVLMGAVMFAIAVRRAGLGWSAVVEGCMSAWLALVVAGYAVPQVLYHKTEGRWVLPLSPALRVMIRATLPLIALLSFFEAVVDLADSDEEDRSEASTEDHVEALITAGTEEGLIEENDRQLIQAAVAFGDKTVREVMTPRPKIVAIEASSSLENLRELLISEQYSRVPVYDETIDRIEGFIHVRDVFELEEDERERMSARDLLRPVRLVPETKPVSELMKEMQQDRAHMVIVIDEYGNTAGLATMEDLVEEILGEIRDEHEPELDMLSEGNGRYVVSGSFDLGRLQGLLDFRPDPGTQSTTVSGLASEWLGRVPSVGDVVERDGLRIEVLAASERRVDRVRVMRAEKDTANE